MNDKKEKAFHTVVMMTWGCRSYITHLREGVSCFPPLDPSESLNDFFEPWLEGAGADSLRDQFIAEINDLNK